MTNKRLLALAKKADLFFEMYGKPYPRALGAGEAVSAYQQFAELIIKECAGVCESMGNQLSVDRPNRDFDEIAWDCEAAILKHFGIE